MASPIDVPQDEVLLPEGGRRVTTVRTAELHVYMDNERGENDRRRRGPREADKLFLRLGYCCLIFPLFFAFSTSAISVVTLVVNNYFSLPDKCDIQCLLSTDGTPGAHPQANCWIVMGGGILVCVMTILFIFTLVPRLCCGAKMYCCLSLIELVVLVLLLGVAALAGGILTLAIEFNSSSLNIALERCEEKVQEKNSEGKVQDKNTIIDFLRQSEISAWASCVFLLLVLIMWLLLMLKFACAKSPRGRHGMPTERDQLINP